MNWNFKYKVTPKMLMYDLKNNRIDTIGRTYTELTEMKDWVIAQNFKECEYSHWTFHFNRKEEYDWFLLRFGTDENET